MEGLVIALISAAVFIPLFIWMAKLEKAQPLKDRKHILAALEEAEAVGVSDIDYNSTGAFRRMKYIKSGVKFPEKYQVQEFLPRLEAQFALLEPYEKRLWEENPPEVFHRPWWFGKFIDKEERGLTC